MQIYGKPITWGTASFPKLFTGVTEDFSYKEAMRQSEEPDENSEIDAFIWDNLVADIDFSARITSGSTNFLDLSTGLKIAITNDAITGGFVLCSEAIEKWTLGAKKTASLKARHYPNTTDVVGGPSAGTLSAYTPGTGSPGSGVIVRPAGKVLWSTSGLSVTYGTVAELSLAQRWTLKEEDDGDGNIGTIIASKYMRTIDLKVTATGDRPPVGTILSIDGAPAHAVGYQITRSELIGRIEDKKAYQLSAVWATCLAA